MEVREKAAELLLTLGDAWEIERLLWLGVRKPNCAGDQGAASSSSPPPMALLTPSMIRRVMKFFILSGGLPASQADRCVEDADPAHQERVSHGEHLDEGERVMGQEVEAILVREQEDEGGLALDVDPAGSWSQEEEDDMVAI